jgi:phospholipid/cholesterol/gamma-HCH transport system substrate-binding protein
VISRKTKVQLAFFVVITLLGVSFVGAKYARLDAVVTDRSYVVVGHFPDSGGIFTGAEVTYRGVDVGRVTDMVVTDAGVDVVMDIENDAPPIPADLQAVVANRSAVGEQYVDFKPRNDNKPYLADGDEIATQDTLTPLSTTKLLIDIDDLVRSVDRKNLRTFVSELGQAFKGAGRDLSTIIDTGNAFIETADANFEVTATLIRQLQPVLRTQIVSRSAIQSFSRDLALFTDTLRTSDADLRRVIANGSSASRTLRAFIEDNEDEIGQLVNQLLTTGKIVRAHLDGLEQVLVVYPYTVEGGFTVVARDPETGLYDAHFGLVTQMTPPVCERGYQGTNKRPPEQRNENPLNTNARCTEPQGVSNARGAQNAPAYNRAPVVAEYDLRTGKLTATSSAGSADEASALDRSAAGAAAFGPDSWKWLLLGPTVQR